MKLWQVKGRSFFACTASKSELTVNLNWCPGFDTALYISMGENWHFKRVGIQNGPFELESPGFHRSSSMPAQRDYNVLHTQTKLNLLEMQKNKTEKQQGGHTLLRQLISLLHGRCATSLSALVNAVAGFRNATVTGLDLRSCGVHNKRVVAHNSRKRAKRWLFYVPPTQCGAMSIHSSARQIIKTPLKSSILWSPSSSNWQAFTLFLCNIQKHISGAPQSACCQQQMVPTVPTLSSNHLKYPTKNVSFFFIWALLS